ncbi:ead/Ea22-like family protein [Pseudocitrobacter faecalis]|uniref:ead/Ea22-like family protein n=1 Tax=Pseudocitrobacter faecalis TaxID=1398493 RepID=UPI0039EDF8E8
MSMTTELAQRMKAAALKATPGEWVYLPSNTSIEYDYGSDDSQGSITYMDSGDFTQKQTELNGIFIALANPANVLALVEALEARDLTLSARDYHYDQQADRIQSLEKALEAAEQNSDGVAGMAEHYETTISMLKSRIAELEARTVKLPATKFCPAEYAGSQLWEEVEIWNKAIEACDAAIRAASVAVEGE